MQVLSIGGYEEAESPTVGNDIWIQSLKGRRSDVWYRLRTAAKEYQRFHQPFLWIADLAKHVVTFVMAHKEVTLCDFQQRFYKSLQTMYGLDGRFVSWWKIYADEDFRRVVVAHANFLFCQASQVDSNLERHPLWNEIHPRFLTAIPEQVERGTEKDMFAISVEAGEPISRRKTTVTPYVYDCFKHLPWAKFLYCQTPSVGYSRHAKVPSSLATDPNPNTGISDVRVTTASYPGDYKDQDITNIEVGDVVALPLDENSAWKTNDTVWYAYVQGATDTDEGRELSLLWIYRPSDTECLQMRYPFAKELFLSDHCNCGDAPIYSHEVQRKVRLAIFGGPQTQDVEFFIRQKYVQGDGAWHTLKVSDLTCSCGKINDNDNGHQYSVDDTILVKLGQSLEPAVFIEHNSRSFPGKIKIRRLLRKQKDYGCRKAAPNELVFTERLQVVPRSSIYRICHVRFYGEHEKIPSPYDRQGTGDFYYITTREGTEGSCLEPLTAPYPSLMKQGWDPLIVSPRAPMLGLDIFCGGGNFGRGLEEGGAVEFDWAVDWYNEAIHTYQANLKHRDEASIFYGSVNDFLTQAMHGKKNHRVAPYGEVEVIAAGSPCQGFSMANPLKGNDRALFNVSMVASVVSFVDFYRPKYALLENVKGMATGKDTENVLAQIMCALVGLGYQVHTFGLDAWNFGSPQRRSRVFIAITAPGLTPLPEPPHTHSHPESVKGASLGKTANGLRSSSRYSTLTPFEYVTAAEATHDLPKTDARTACIAFPDHKMSRTLSTLARVLVSSIPKFPGGASFMRANERGYMPQVQIDSWGWHNPIRSRRDSRAWQRVRGNALLPTVLTRPTPEDGVCGNVVHWDEDRLLSIMEVRRAQGFLDHEILIGLPGEQWKIIGNSVARTVALALGMSLRTAWLANDMTPESIAPTATTSEIAHELATIQLPIRPELETTDGEGVDSRQRTMDILNRLKTSLKPPTPVNATPYPTAGKLVTDSRYYSTEPPSDTPSNQNRTERAPQTNTKFSEAEKLCDEALDILTLDEHGRPHKGNVPSTSAMDPHHDPNLVSGRNEKHDGSLNSTSPRKEVASTNRPVRFVTNEITVSKFTITKTTSVEREVIE